MPVHLHVVCDCIWATVTELNVTSKPAMFSLFPDFFYKGKSTVGGLGRQCRISSLWDGFWWSCLASGEWTSWALGVPSSPSFCFILTLSWVRFLHGNAFTRPVLSYAFIPLGQSSINLSFYPDLLRHHFFRGKSVPEASVFLRHILWPLSIRNSPTIYSSLLLHSGCWLLLKKFTQPGKWVVHSHPFYIHGLSPGLGTLPWNLTWFQISSSPVTSKGWPA